MFKLELIIHANLLKQDFNLGKLSTIYRVFSIRYSSFTHTKKKKNQNSNSKLFSAN